MGTYEKSIFMYKKVKRNNMSAFSMHFVLLIFFNSKVPVCCAYIAFKYLTNLFTINFHF